jgi:hypothetical protein
MKRLLIFFLLLPGFLPAQLGWDELDTLPYGTKRIVLPATKNQSRYGGREFIITRDADYKSLFADSLHAGLPKIDFERYELMARSFCMQCIVTCNGHPQCHRNACMYTRGWYLAEKKQRIVLVADTLDGSACSFLPGFVNEMICRDDSSFSELKRSCPKLKNDSVDFSRRIVVVQKKYLDCAAKVGHEFYLDTVKHCLVWRLYSGYRGCHRMDERSFVFSVPKPPEGYTIRFEHYALPSEW